MSKTKACRSRISLTLQCAFLASGIAFQRIKADAQLQLGEKSTLLYATAEQGRKVLTKRDDFVERMSPFDRAARMKTDRDVSEEEYLKFAGANVLEWSDNEKQKISSAFRDIQPALAVLRLPFPATVLCVKTTGNEEGGAAYTRANAIVFPKGNLSGTPQSLREKMAHELFHVLSRANPALRDKLYEVIGFVACEEVAFPAELISRKITNPDAPKNDHCIKIKVSDEESWGIPILYSKSEKYDVRREGQFFDYLQFKVLLVDRVGNTPNAAIQLRAKEGKARLAGVEQITGFFERVGQNTGYILHPEEILADNFAMLVMGKRDVPSPAVIQRMEAILKSSTQD